jgi:iron complex outermembrane receptor protein
VAPVAGGWQASGSLSLTERAPTYFELYANGVHLATGAFERGDPNLRPERGVNLDLSTSWTSGPHRLSGGVWAARFGRYLSLDATGVDIPVPDEEGGVADFPEFAFRAVPARFHGAELAGRMRLFERPWSLDLTGQFDWLRARNGATGEPLPRVAPWRTTLGFDATRGSTTVRVEWIRVGDQDRVPATDTATPGFDRINLLWSQEWQRGAARGLWFVRLDNATNALGFNAGSIETVRRLSPLPGRSVRLGLRVDL